MTDFDINKAEQAAVRDKEGKIITIISHWSQDSSFISFFTRPYEGHHSSMMNSEINERVQSGEWKVLGDA